MKRETQLTERQRALVEENLSLVRQAISRHIRYNESVCGMGYDDLFQEGAWALCHAAMTYDGGGRGVPFSAYARPVIRNHLLDYCRRVLAQRERLPTVSFDTPAGEDQQTPEQRLESAHDDTEDWDAKILVEQILEHGKRTYSGVARLGIEALELKIKGYTGADIARLYDTRSNHVGAWISRAADKLRKDDIAAQLLEYDVESKAAGF